VTARGGQRSRPGIVVHHGRLQDEDVETIGGIPTTTAGRTLVDCAESITSWHRFHKLIDSAFDQRDYDHGRTLAAMARMPRRRGTHLLARALKSHDAGAYRGENEFEDLLVPILVQHGLPLPQTQVSMVLTDGSQIRPQTVAAAIGARLRGASP